jgi:hypothetical protein|tara:strand:+ start:7073 stop:7810 length:738 start_codon:yes stop_codon:yes gene_type:complete
MDCQEYDLVAFGCSFTYGHGLQDCIGEDGVSNGPTPSVLAWPNQLKTLCNFKTVDNQSEPGASNKIITKRIIEYKKYTKKSFVVIQWSNFDRHTIFLAKDNIKRIHMMPNFLSDIMPKDFWQSHSQNSSFNPKEYKEIIKMYYGYYHHEFDVYFNNIIKLNYVDTWLKSKGIECRHVFGEHEWNNETLKINKGYFNKYMLSSVKIKTFNFKKDFHIDDALDYPNPHPGIGSHKLFAHNIKKWFKL